MDQGKEGRKPGWFWADNKILDTYAAQIGPHATLVYMVLVRHLNQDGQCWPSFQTIGKMLKISRRTVINSIEKLVEVGLITVEARHDAKKGQMTNLYTVMCVAEVGKQEAQEPRSASPTPVQEVHPPSEPYARPPVQEVHPNKTYRNKTQGTSGGVEPLEPTGPRVAAAIDTTTKELMVAGGLNLKQARVAVSQQTFTPELLERIKLWSERIRAAGKSPGAILCGYTDAGLLPDDLPAAAAPVVSHDEAIRRHVEDAKKGMSHAAFR